MAQIVILQDVDAVIQESLGCRLAESYGSVALARLLRGHREYFLRGVLLLLPPPKMEYKGSSDE